MEQRSEIKLSPNSWHAKLIDWVFGFKPKDFRNLCPYFWLLVASLFLVILVTPFKLLGKLGIKVIENLDDLLSERVDKAFDRFVESLDRGEIYSLLGNTDSEIRKELGFFHKSELVRNRLQIRLLRVTRGKDWMSKLREAVLDKYKEDDQWKGWSKYFDDEAHTVELELAAVEKRNQKKQRRSRTRKETIAEITEITKAFVKCLGTIGVAILVYFVSWIFTIGLTYTFTRSFGDYLVLLRIIGIILLGAACIIYGFWCYDQIKEWFKYRSSKAWFEWALLIPAVPFAISVLILKVIFIDFIFDCILKGIFDGIVQGVTEYGGIFAEYFNASYSDYCPGINWEEKEK